MLTKEQNERLTRVGPGTPCGELLRRYWQPLCAASELTDKRRAKAVRILGEDLVVFRQPDGAYGCVEEFCAHRRTSLRYGLVEPGGIRCPYHGWKYDGQGRCMEQPFEREDSQFRSKIALKAYPVQKLGGLLFAYLGPDAATAPLLPRWDVIAREDGERILQQFPLYRCNWLQVQENTADSVHTYFLHGELSDVLGLEIDGVDYYKRPIEHYEWSVCDWGVDKVIVYGGDRPEKEIRPPLIFPNILRIPQGPIDALHWRVPIDDTHTRIIWMGFLPESAGGKPMSSDFDPPIRFLKDARDSSGEYDLSTVYNQDQMAMETQGIIADRSRENLGGSDRGIAMFRQQLDEQIARVEQGKEPTLAMVRDPEKNRLIEFPAATTPWGSTALSLPAA